MRPCRTDILLIIAILISQSKLDAQDQRLAVGFYNLENLFDTLDDPNVLDEEFLPSGDKNWTLEKYRDKLGRLAKVIRNMQTDLKEVPLALLGVCEIENQGVLEDLVRHPLLNSFYYKIVHRDSRDYRGVDVALLYRSEFFQVLQVKAFALELPPDGDRPRKTRDILLIKGLLGDQLTFITVNHWPSRRGGEKETQAFRMMAALKNRAIADSIRAKQPEARFIVMGDLNDNPEDPSLIDGLGASSSISKVQTAAFFNPFYDMFAKGEGSGAHDDRWGLFDQIIVSDHFIHGKTGWKLHGQRVFRKNYMIEKSGHYKNYPKRTFSGNQYNYGYSDHFPVYCILRMDP